MRHPVLGHFYLTTDHAASSYGIPVLVGPDNTAYGPGDILGSDAPLSCQFQPAGHMVRRWTRLTGRTVEEQEGAQLFLSIAGE